jgi:hypothetical protein
LKHIKYIFDIPIPFCHNLYLSATLKQFLTEFAPRYHPPFSNFLQHLKKKEEKKKKKRGGGGNIGSYPHVPVIVTW